MCRRAVMLVLPHVGGELGVDNPAERHKPERESSNDILSNLISHRLLSESRCLDWRLFLNPRDSVIDLLLSQ